MQARTALFSAALVLFIAAPACEKKPAADSGKLTGEGLPPKGNATDAPEFVRSLSLIYPQAELYRVDNRIIQKTNHRLKDITGYFTAALAKHGFSEATRLEQDNGALLQFERRLRPDGNNRSVCRGGESACVLNETISIDISKLPYADNFLIRVGRSEVDYSKGGDK
ncbi:MAG: hypothetical protein JNJ69_13120 [Leptospiraceae bacterium]|nr:hypothetical protein [Leptospiraceae bacterium]